MAKKKQDIPQYKTTTIKGKQYYRTRITDADGKQASLYALTCEELYKKEQAARAEVQEIIFRRKNPTVADYCEKWLLMRSATVSDDTIQNYRRQVDKYIVKPLGTMYLSDVTSDDIKIAMIPLAKKSSAVYNQVNMLFKSIFYNAERSEVIDYNPAAKINAKGGVPAKPREALSDEQVQKLLDTVRDLPTNLFIMIGLYSGLRREEILGLQWDCVFLDVTTPYISVQRAWRTKNNRPEVSTVLKTKAARRDIPIPKCLVDCLREAKENSISDFVIADKNGEALSDSQYARLWNYVKVRTAKNRTCYKYVNGQRIKYVVEQPLGGHAKNNSKIVYSLDFSVTPHQLRHTYITNLLYAGVDPKTVQYLAGHENSKTTMDIYAKIKYNKPKELLGVVNAAFGQQTAM
ncbi:site-specific integrase [Holdemania sp. Marseille-P2844]|uniref:tyrosine-type recombinase/integrase n=1 Tax=Holdemania sp. Marseille-P2844 TaxID=1852366 RepID=UPI0009340B0E|nr:site-specific integrase [Holdemania sp. Marseille-P2844]